MKRLALSLGLDTFAVQYAVLHWSLLSQLWACHLYVLSGCSGSCNCFRLLLRGLSRVSYQEAVATSLVECCSFFFTNFNYISDCLCDVKIISICLFGVEQWSAEAVYRARLGLAIKLPEYRLDVVLVSLLVALDGFDAIYWCSVVDFKQVLV